MSTLHSDDDVQDMYDYWHLYYQGEQELDEFMKSQLNWTDMEYQYWEVTGKLPGDEGNG